MGGEEGNVRLRRISDISDQRSGSEKRKANAETQRAQRFAERKRLIG
jgi:hypothetical protein